MKKHLLEIGLLFILIGALIFLIDGCLPIIVIGVGAADNPAGKDYIVYGH